MKRRVGIGWCLLLAFGVVSGSTEDERYWPQFRGSEAGVVPDDPTLPDRWSETENVVWVTDIPGLGWSSPIVWGDHLFVTTAVRKGTEPAEVGSPDSTDGSGGIRTTASVRWVVFDLDVDTGSVRWERTLHTGIPPMARQVRNTYATETAVTDGKRVYVSFGAIGLLAALDLDGKLVWTNEIGVFERFQPWGVASSPALHGNRLYVVNDNNEESYIAAFDTETGGGPNARRSRTGRRPSSGRTTNAPRSSRRANNESAPTTSMAPCCGSSAA